jgi:hypothetical protein
MRINSNTGGDSPESNPEDINLVKTLKNVEDLPDELKQMVSAQASHLAESLARQSLAAHNLHKEDSDEEPDALALTLLPFIMELSFLKLQLAATASQLEELTNG